MNPLQILRLVGGLVLLASNGFFVTTEFALTRVRQFDEDQFTGSSALKLAWDMTDRLELYLTGCQVGITISSIGLGITAEPALTHLLQLPLQAIDLPLTSIKTISIATSVILINLAHVVLGEQVPTYLGVEKARGVLKWCAHLHYYWTTLMYPVIYLGDKTAKWILGWFGIKIERSWTDEEEVEFGDLRRQMGEILSRGELDRERREEVMKALEIEDIPVRDIMVPREEMEVLSTENSSEENLNIVKNSSYARFPVIGERPEEFIGIVYAQTLLEHLNELTQGEIDISDLAVSPMIVPESLSVAALIDRFQDEHQELTFIREEDGERIIGLVTTTDAFEAIIGPLEDPADQPRPDGDQESR